jgi:hypothetical protein
MALPDPIQQPTPRAPQQSYTIAREGGISWGSYNINTDLITDYYKGLGKMVSTGADVYQNYEKLKFEKLQWDYKIDQEDKGNTETSLFNLMQKGMKLYDNPMHFFTVGRIS